MKDYSQSGEQEFILEFFRNKPDGRFLEIGAMDGISYSNTYALLLKGWEGLYFEPSPLAFAKLLETTKDYKALCVNEGLADFRGELAWYDGGMNALGTTDKAHKEVWEKAGAKFQDSVMRVTDWEHLCLHFGTNFDLISIDTEGTSQHLFKTMPYKLNPAMVIVEHDGKDDTEFERIGYGIAVRNDLNLIMTHSTYFTRIHLGTFGSK